jgi:hypothetical protein
MPHGRVAIDRMRASLCGESVPRLTAGVNDNVVAVEDAIAELVLAQELPDVFSRVKLRRIWRQVQQTDVGWQLQSCAGLMPACTVKDDDGIVARVRDGTRDQIGKVFYAFPALRRLAQGIGVALIPAESLADAANHRPIVPRI